MRIILLFILLGSSIASNAQSWLWAKSAGGIDSETGMKVCTDPVTGDVIVAGVFNGTLNFGTTVLSNTNFQTYDIFVAKYSSAGTIQWARSFGSFDSEQSSSICCDASGNIYIAGSTNSSVLILGSDTLTNYGGFDWFILELDPSGNVVWSTNGGGNANDLITDIALDVTGNVYATGFFFSPSFAFGTGTVTNVAGTSSDLFLLKFNASGNELWGKAAGGNSDDKGNKLSVDNAGNVIVVGSFMSSTFNASGSILTNTNVATKEIAVLKYDPSGTLAWAKKYGGSGEEDANDVAADASGNVVITGYFQSQTLTVGTYNLVNNAVNSSDILVFELEPSGTVKWAISGGGINEEYGTEIAFTQQGNIALLGKYIGGFLFDSISIPGAPSINFYLASLDSTGNVNSIVTPVNQYIVQGYGLALDNNDNMYVTGGYVDVPVTFGATVLSNAGYIDVFLAKYGTITAINDDQLTAGLNIYPNPSQGYFRITSSSVINEIEILNTTGQLIYHAAPKENSLLIEIEDNGIYFCRIFTNDGVVVKRIEVVR